MMRTERTENQRTGIPGIQNLLPQRPFSRIIFSPQEDQKLIRFFNMYPNQWQTISNLMKNRSPRVCRDRFRFINMVNTTTWTRENDNDLIDYVRIYGHNWSYIATKFPGFSEEFVRNRWNLNLKYKVVDNYINRYIDNSNKAIQEQQEQEHQQQESASEQESEESETEYSSEDDFSDFYMNSDFDDFISDYDVQMAREMSKLYNVESEPESNDGPSEGASISI